MHRKERLRYAQDPQSKRFCASRPSNKIVKLTGSGSALTLEEDQRDAAAILAALERLLHDATFSSAAQRVAAEIAALPHPDEYVPTLESLAHR